MATKPDENDDFQWEIEDETAEKPQVEVVDDTPEADRGREPMPKEIVEELESDELEDYSEKVKVRLKQMKKVWHDERREKERVLREQQEALSAAQRLLEENRRLKKTLSEGEQSLVGSYKQTAEYEVEAAKRAYRDAYESGDADKVVDAQEKLVRATSRLQQVENYQPTLQEADTEVDIVPQQVQQPRLDQKTTAWQERNTWYGTDPEMTASALGLHQKLVNERGPQFVGTDEYWVAVDKTMRRRFPDYFGEEEAPKTSQRESKSAPVVAPASRSRSPKKIVLKQSQIAIAKRLGLTPEQYARELMKTEN
jgi:hypothetical protein